MAITGRAARATQFTAYTTPNVVGPGSYLKTEREPTMHGFAPFSSTVERSGPVVATFKSNPGPGAYQRANIKGQMSESGGAGAAFASKVARMPQDTDIRRLAPGPGKYVLQDPWSKGRRGEAGQSATAKHAVALTKGGAQSNPPSIPAPDQSFGYEETPMGELKLQRPP